MCQAPMKPVSILLVEDDQIDAKAFMRAMETQRISNPVIRAKDGVEAWEILKGMHGDTPLARPHIIILDINMPRMNGHEFLEAVRNDAETRDARVYVFTTSDSKRDVSLAYRNNANGYIVKPTGSRDLVGILETLQAYWSICECPD